MNSSTSSWTAVFAQECPSERETLRTLGALLSKHDLSLPVGQCLLSQGGLEPLGALLLPWPLLSSPHRGGMLVWAPHMGVAAGLCHSEGSCLMETLQDRQGIKQSRAPVMWAGAGQKGKKKRVCSSWSWFAETWDIFISWGEGTVTSKLVTRGRLFHHNSAEERDSHTCRADTPHMPISLISKWEPPT